MYSLTFCSQVYSYGQTAHSHASDPVVFETGGKSNRTRREGRVGGGSRREVSLAEPAGSGGWVDCVCLSFILCILKLSCIFHFLRAF